MLQVKKRSFSDSYLYNKEADAHNKTIVEFILKSRRIEDKKADAMIVDIDQWNHKMIWYKQPKGIDKVAKQQIKKWKVVKLDEKTLLHFYVDIRQHQSIKCDNKKPLTIWIGTKEEVNKQLNEIYTKSWFDPETTDFLKFVPNIDNIESKLPKKEWERNINNKKPQIWPRWPKRNNEQQLKEWSFSVKDIKLWEEYDGYVKLMYNYWMFITVKGVEWLLHKKQIVAPDGVDWKKYYNIWDKIKVKAHEFKDINWEKRVVWTQL